MLKTEATGETLFQKGDRRYQKLIKSKSPPQYSLVEIIPDLKVAPSKDRFEKTGQGHGETKQSI